MKTRYKHIHFKDVSALFVKRTTKTFDCYSNSFNELGVVKWHSLQGQYCFFTMISSEERTIFAESYLLDIVDFIKQLNDERKKKMEKCYAKTKKR